MTVEKVLHDYPYTYPKDPQYEEMADWMYEMSPAEVHVSNNIIATTLHHICSTAGTKLVRKDKLTHTSEIAEEFVQMMRG